MNSESFDIMLNRNKIKLYEKNNFLFCYFLTESKTVDINLRSKDIIIEFCDLYLHQENANALDKNHKLYKEKQKPVNKIVRKYAVDFTLENIPNNFVLRINDKIDIVIILERKLKTYNEKEYTRIFESDKTHIIGDLRLNSNEKILIEEGAFFFGKIILDSVKNVVIEGNGMLLKLPKNYEKEDIKYQKNETGIYCINSENISVNGLKIFDYDLTSIKLQNCKNINLKDLKCLSLTPNSHCINIIDSQFINVEDCFLKSNGNILQLNDTTTCIEAIFLDINFKNLFLWNEFYGNSVKIYTKFSCLSMKRINFLNIYVFEYLSPENADGSFFDIVNTSDATISDINLQNITLEHTGKRIFRMIISKTGIITKLNIENIDILDDILVPSVFIGNKDCFINNILVKDFFHMSNKFASAKEADFVLDFCQNIKFL